MKNIILTLAAAALVAVSCQSEDLLIPDAPVVDDGYVTVEFTTSIPDMEIVHTRAVDPDGEAITKLVFFCFNERGLFISKEEADIQASGDFNGKYKVDLPVVTDRVHIIANQHKNIDEDKLAGLSESQVISTMVGSSGMMSYWARVAKGNAADIKAAFETDYKNVSLLRDHARITVSDKSSTYTDLAFVAINTNAFGTVAPFNNGSWEAPSLDNMFVTLPESDIKESGVADVVSVSQRKYQYVFETENTADDPVYVIIKGTRNGTAKYYRVMLIDKDGNYVPVMRNFTYDVQITGEMEYGQDSYDAALNAPVTNNVWVSVSDDIKQVSSTQYTLAVRETHIVLGENDPVFNTSHMKYTVHYSLEALGSTVLTAGDKPEISWLDGNNVAQHTLSASEFTVSADGKSAEGTIEIILLELGDQKKREGTLLIKKGLLERKVNIISVAKQKFTPAWITTNIYGAETGSNVTMMFHISKDCPEALFPIDVLVSVNDMDVRNASGMVLPVITETEEGYGEDNGIGYKYVLTVTEPGDQRLYLETILKHDTGDNVSVTIEAKNFETVTKTATFQDETDKRILIHNLRSYLGAEPADEYIYYYLVPQKVNAPVEFETHLGQVVGSAPAAGQGTTLTDPDGTVTHFRYISPNVDFTTPNVDEFLLYSQNLEHNHHKPAGTSYYFDFYEIEESKWSSTAGRVMGFFRNNTAGISNHGATLYLRTTTPKSNEIVRIATNPKGQPSVTTGEKGDLAAGTYVSPLCTGEGLYKSVIFELTTFSPFHFSAQVKQGSNVVGGVETGAVKPAEETMSLDYAPGQQMSVEFDVTSFKSSMQGVADNQQVSVDPFGTAFDIYIDAPTLELDEAAISAAGLSDKIRKDANVPGRVIYTVDASRETERAALTGGFSTSALSLDNATLDCVNKNTITVNQAGERKIIPFRTKDIVSAGDITISSDESKVVYYTKTFKIENRPMSGIMTYGSGSTPVPAGTFIPFSTDDGTRIGVVTVGENGEFTLRLRAEYDFTWDSTPVKFECKIGEVEYEAGFDSLKDLASTSTAIILN